MGRSQQNSLNGSYSSNGLFFSFLSTTKLCLTGIIWLNTLAQKYKCNCLDRVSVITGHLMLIPSKICGVKIMLRVAKVQS